MKIIITLTAAALLSACAVLSDDPCAAYPDQGCRAVSKTGNAGEINFTLADGRVIETWAPMAVTGAP